jgi:hypothetical protein
MTKAENVRNDFKAFFPRIVQNDLLSSTEAVKRTTELLDIVRGLMRSAGLDPDGVAAGIVFTQPESPGLEHVPAQSLDVPPTEEMPAFVAQIEALDRPIFLGVLFSQFDPETLRVVRFVWPFMAGPKAEKGLMYVRDRAPEPGILALEFLAKGGLEA